MLRNCQARLLDDVYLDDIPKIVPPDVAYRYLSDTAEHGRIVREWDLPDGYSLLVRRYLSMHFQQPHMAYRDALNEVKSGNIVILRRTRGTEYGSIENSDGSLISTLPLFLRSRLDDVARRQLVRPVGTRSTYPAPESQTGNTINSKAAGRLLAAGGIYNGNIEGFRKTAEQLGGDAPAGYDQVMNSQTKGMVIAGASVAMGLGIGRLTPSEIKSLDQAAIASHRSEKIGEFSISQLSKSASVMDKGGLTKAGRALQKHGDRLGSVFPKATGDPAAKNAQGQSVVERILNDEKKTIIQKNTGRYGQVTDISSPNGRGVRYDSEGNLIGFLEP